MNRFVSNQLIVIDIKSQGRRRYQATRQIELPGECTENMVWLSPIHYVHVQTETPHLPNGKGTVSIEFVAHDKELPDRQMSVTRIVRYLTQEGYDQVEPHPTELQK